ncbi:MAG TPA: ATP-binding protein [Planctomycetota bacterium]|nr:ATP-binding protein [Planctomycetota bacterium]
MSGAGEADQGRELHLELPAAHSAVREARQAVRRFASSGGIRGRELETVVLVASELLSNAVDHGGGCSAMEAPDAPEVPDVPGAPETAEGASPAGCARMSIRLSLREGGWEMRVSDQGGGDPGVLEALLRGSGEAPDLADERGRGLFLLTSLVDEVRVQRSADGLGLSLIAVREHARGR